MQVIVLVLGVFALLSVPSAFAQKSGGQSCEAKCAAQCQTAGGGRQKASCQNKCSQDCYAGGGRK